MDYVRFLKLASRPRYWMSPTPQRSGRGYSPNNSLQAKITKLLNCALEMAVVAKVLSEPQCIC